MRAPRQAFKATGSKVAEISHHTAKATEHAYKATEGAVVGAAKATEKAVQDGVRRLCSALCFLRGRARPALQPCAQLVDFAFVFRAAMWCTQASKTANFVSDTTASAVQATHSAAETIKQGATTPLGKKKKSPLGPFG